jgi:hypothetical protein
VEPHSQPATWIETIGWISLAAAFASALAILGDIYLRGHRQKMAIMEAVYPITALYWGPFALWFYFRHGRRDSKPVIDKRGAPDPDTMPRWVVLSKAVSHCGAGCTVGDIIGEWLVVALGLTIAGKALFVDMPMDFALAWTLGIVFQYFTIVPMRDVSRRQGIWAAVKADTLSIVAFQVGLFAGMVVYQMVLWSEPLPKTTATYWMMMQLSMILGFFTAMPVNSWLINKGVKEKM